MVNPLFYHKTTMCSFHGNKMIIFYFVLISIFNRCTLGDGKNLTIYWNVPTHLCQKYDYDFERLLVPNTFKVNRCDSSQGDKIVVLRNPGLFPRAKKYENGTFYCNNKCITQGANLSLHLDQFSKDIKRTILNPNFNGLAVIQFEDWNPLFALNNWGHTQWHKDMALSVEKWFHPYPESESLQLDELAEDRFNEHARQIFEETLKLGQKLRPHAKWGFYNYPKCSNMGNDSLDTCNQDILNTNDILLWLVNDSDALFPTFNFQLSHAVKNKIYEYPLESITIRLEETKRLVEKTEKKPKVYPYLYLKFIDDKLYINKVDIDNIFKKIKEINVADGVILWLKEEDLDSKEKCERFYNLTSNDYLPTLKHTGIIPKITPVNFTIA